MHKLFRALLIICVCLLLVVAVRFGTAQNTVAAPPPDDGAYGEPSLPNFTDDDPNAPPDDANEVRDRMAANRSSIGDLTEEIKLNAIQELQRQQLLYPQQLAGANPPNGVPSWRSLGPTQAKYQTNVVTLQVSDSGRIRTILPHPTDPDTLYVLTSGGGLWKTTTFTHTNPRWDA